MEDSSNIIDQPEEVGGEEEADEYEGTLKLKQLSEMLGAPIENNEIKYNGHIINYFSETEKLHVDNNKAKFDKPEEVVEFLKSKNISPNLEKTTESRKNRINNKR